MQSRKRSPYAVDANSGDDEGSASTGFPCARCRCLCLAPLTCATSWAERGAELTRRHFEGKQRVRCVTWGRGGGGGLQAPSHRTGAPLFDSATPRPLVAAPPLSAPPPPPLLLPSLPFLSRLLHGGCRVHRAQRDSTASTTTTTTPGTGPLCVGATHAGTRTPHPATTCKRSRCRHRRERTPQLLWAAPPLPFCLSSCTPFHQRPMGGPRCATLTTCCAPSAVSRRPCS